ncbi:MAG: PrsW family glutamic-type intramembrane protease, partial [Candidatus Hydrothermarchaeaceae archaeon]
KFLSISSFIALQFVLWLVLLRLQGIPIHNILLVFLILMAVNAAVISTAVAMGIYSKSAKEANISLMLLYVLVSVALIISLSMEYFGSYKFFEILPFISISRLVVGESVSAAALLFLIFYLSAYSVLLLTTSVKLLKRDDIVFGPRPSVFSLFTDFIESLRAKFEKNPLLGTSIVASVSGAISVVISAVVEVSFGVVLLFFLGYSTFTVSLMIIFFAFVEELLKPLFIFSLARKRPDLILRKSRGFFYGAASGISFFFFENIFFASMVFLTFPGLILQILTLRMGTTLVVHTLSSGFVGVGISSLVRGRRAVFIFLLALSTFIHSMYNFAVLGVLP